MRRPLVLLGLTLTTVLWVGALVEASSARSPVLAAATYAAGSLLCHQQPARSFYRHDAQLPVCARCFGLYVGTCLGVLGWAALTGIRQVPASRAREWLDYGRMRRLVFVCALPTLVTVALAFIGWWDLSNAARAILGVPAGAGIAAAVAASASGDLR